MPDTDPTTMLDPEYRTLVETASLDWQVAQYVRHTDRLVEHSSHEIAAAGIAQIARQQHGEAFDTAVARYRS